MDSRRKVVFTDAAVARRAQLLDTLEKDIDNAIIDMKYVPGADFVEVTASDVEEIARTTRIGYRDRMAQRSRYRRVLLISYMLVGATMLFAGLYYKELVKLSNENPTQLIMVMSGVLIMITAAVLQVLTVQAPQKPEYRDERDFLRALDQHADDSSGNDV